VLEYRGQLVLSCGLGLAAGGLILGIPAALLVAVLLLVGLLEEVMRLQRALTPSTTPWSIRAALAPVRGESVVKRPVDRSQRVGQEIHLEVELAVAAPFDGLTLVFVGWEHTDGLSVAAEHRAVTIGARHPRRVPIQVKAGNAAVHRIFGFRAWLMDAMGLLQADVFVPCPHEVAVLPRSLMLAVEQLAETRRNAARATAGARPDHQAGHGDEVRELREHRPGDPFKHIAWKASARRGQLMSRSFERERSRAMYVVLDTGAPMRAGVAGHAPIDQAFDFVHSLSQQSSLNTIPFGLSLVDGDVVANMPVCQGIEALRRTDRALLDVRRTVDESLAPLSDEGLIRLVASYLRAVEGVNLQPVNVTQGVSQATRQRVVMAALARLPARERMPALRGPEPSERLDMAILRRFCRAMDLALPYRRPLSSVEHARGLMRGVVAAMSSRRGPFNIIVVSDFGASIDDYGPLWQACRLARSRGHRLVVVTMPDGSYSELLSTAQAGEELDTIRGLVRAERVARRQFLDELADGCHRVGAVLVADPRRSQLVSIWAAATA
jgi:uncharacterized protein (DUF58 family)